MLPALLYLFAIHSTHAYWRPPAVNVNLDSGEDTWNDAIDTILQLHGFDYSFGPIFERQNKSIFNHIPPQDFSIFASTIKQNWPDQYAELSGISKRFIYHGYYVSTEYLCGWAYYHELYHVQYNTNNTYNSHDECTGVLIRDINDTIWQGRNHDPSQGWNVTLSLSFYKNNQLIFEGRDYYWFATGVVTAFKNNVLSVQENAKHQNFNYSEMLKYIQEGRIPVTFLFRQMLMQDGITYEKGVEYICNIPLSVPIYAIVGGLEGSGDGSIITKYQNDCVLLTFNNISNHSTGNYGNVSIPWYMVETNSDVWISDGDGRRTLAENLLSEWDREYDTQERVIGANLMAVMSSYNVYNKGTVSTSIMSAKHGIFVGYVEQPLKETCEKVNAS